MTRHGLLSIDQKHAENDAIFESGADRAESNPGDIADHNAAVMT